jgi:hypothetical protein
MRLRLFAILALALLFSVFFTGSPLATHNQPSVSLADCSPPAGLELPVGQGVEVRCRLKGETRASVEILVNGVPFHSGQVPLNGVTALSWIPSRTGLHTLEVVVRTEGREAAKFTRTVFVVAPGSPVRIR